MNLFGILLSDVGIGKRWLAEDLEATPGLDCISAEEQASHK
jgi:hypothetical protein